jgi:hypothetical protein
VASGESYVAGGAALNVALNQSRLSRDIDIFHDGHEAVARSWIADRRTLRSAGYVVRPLVERPGYVEATVERGGDRVELQWAEDSAYRFFPLVGHPEFGLTLHPFDLATNKVLALVGRLEVRDWIDVIACDSSLQPVGYLAWAASSKDPGLSPAMILAEGARVRYASEEVAAIAFEGPPPDAADLSRAWRAALARARKIVDLLPAARVGTCLLDRAGALVRADPEDLNAMLARREVNYHRAVLRGAYPVLVRNGS